MRNFLLLTSFFLSAPAYAYLTSDVGAATGYTSFNMKSSGNSINMTSLTNLYISYNLNNAAWNTAFNLDMQESLQSSQGPLAWTRLGFGFKFYPTGFNAQRVIFDNRVDGVYWRPAPFAGIGLGISTLSVSSVGGAAGNFNASVMDVSLKAGAEVVLTSNLFLTGELNLIQGLAAQSSRTVYDISYTAIGVFMGLKLVSF